MIEVFGPLSIITLIFGGCCSNVYTLEEILKQEPASGLLITFLQFWLASALSAPTQLKPAATPPPASKPAVPFTRWVAIASMFYAVNMLNNWAFAFSISVPVHIILRSFGSVWTMGAGYLRGKRYTKLQTFSVVLLTLGVIFSAWADAESKDKDLSATAPKSMWAFLTGLLILLAAQILSAYMGIFVQDTYAAYTTTWQENLFFSHFISLPLFIPFAPALGRQLVKLTETPSLSSFLLSIAARPGVGPQPWLLKTAGVTKGMSSGVFFLLLNGITQLACISGVNLLSSRSSAVTVTIVLNVRKLVSFIFSTWLFGHELSGRMAIGATLVFGSGALYGWETTWRVPRERKAKAEQASVGGKKEQ